MDTWIAVIFDLVEKVRELAASGDAEAVQINSTYERYISQIDAGNDQGIKNALEFERTLIDLCRSRLGFFGHQEMRDLNRLREDRHQCAHPSFSKLGEPFRPTAELARLHLRIAVEHVLSQPPIQGRAAIERLVAEVSSDYFPRNQAQAISLLEAGPLGRPSDALVRNFVDRLVFGYATPEDALYGKEQVAVALIALREMHRVHAEPRIATQLSKLAVQVSDGQLGSIAALISKSGNAPLIGDPAQIRLAEFIRTGPIAEVATAIAGLSRNAALVGAAENRVANLGREDVEAVIASGGAHLVRPRVLALLSEVGSWNSANLLFGRLVDPVFDYLSPEDVRTIVRMPTATGADLPGASGYSDFINEVRRRRLLSDAELNLLLRENRAGFLVLEAD